METRSNVVVELLLKRGDVEDLQAVLVHMKYTDNLNLVCKLIDVRGLTNLTPEHDAVLGRVT